MAITDAVNVDGDLVFVYDRWVTCLGDEDGNAPTVSDLFTACTATKVVQSAGGQRLDFAQLQYALTDYLTDREQPSSFKRMVAVYMPDSSQTRIHLGDYVQETEAVRQNGDMLSGSSQVRSYHFGEPVRGYMCYSMITNAQELIEDDIIFNPIVDGRTLPNRSSDAYESNGDAYRFVHPEQCLTEQAEAYQSDVPELWTLSEAVLTVCVALNSDEEFIENPTESELSVITDEPPLRDVKISLGWRLPQALDRLLIPFGYNWYTDYAVAGKPKIKVFKIGEGTEKILYLQAPGSYLDLSESNVNQYEVSRSIGDSFNQVLVYGDFERYEVTLPLLPAWDAEGDNLEGTDLDKSDENSDYVGKELVWRQWIANEAGDLDESRDFGSLDFTVPRLDEVFTTWVPHRRNIEEPLTYVGADEKKQRRPILVEYSTDAGASWLPIPENWPVKLLPDQIGILFDGDQPPDELITAGDEARVRITGTIAGDARLQGLAERGGGTLAANGRLFEQVLMAEDKFQFRKRLDSGDYKSVFTDITGTTADEIDHTDEILDYAEKIRDQNHHAEVDAEFRLPGLHLEYEIGDLITSIDGRNINLDAASSASATHRYPQIVQRIFEFGDDGPFTVLTVDRGTPPIQETA